jgi:PAS domain S-box-containing protein
MEVTCVSEPEEVFENIETGEYHCLVTDYNMPRMNGIELATKVREKSSIPIILYTGQGSEAVAEKAFLIGIDDYLRKETDPSHYKVLAKRIRHAVDKKQIEILYENVMSQTHYGVCIFVDGVIEFANNAAINLFEKKNLEDILGKNPFSVTNSDSLRYLETGEHEYIFRKRRSERKYLEISNRQIQYNGENAVLSFIWDSTEKKSLEIENLISQERFRSLVELSPDGIATFSTGGYMTFLNRAFCTLTGFDRDELLGKHLTTLRTLRKRDLLKYIRSFTAALQGRLSPSMEFTYNKKDGSTGVGESHIGLIDVSGTKEMLLIARDITEKKKQETRYEKLFETSPEGVIELDVNGNIKTVNKTLKNYIDFNENKFLEKSIYKMTFINQETKSKLKKLIETVRKSKKFRSIEFEIIKEKHNNLWVEANISPIIFDDEVLGYQMIMRDISERKESEEENRKYKEKLENLVELKTSEIINNERLVAAGKAATMIGHDIRNPLSIINSCVYMLKNEKTYNESLLQTIEDHIGYCVELLSRFKDQTRTDPVRLDYYIISDLIESSLSPLEVNENIEVIRSVSPNIPLMKIDGFQIRRVLENIISNAVHAMPEGGKLLITAEVRTDSLEISITDSGIGIPMEKIETIFEPFYSTKHDGIGLGLSFCKRVVEEHGGNIEVISEVDVGTTFIIKLPINQENYNVIEADLPEIDVEQ